MTTAALNTPPWHRPGIIQIQNMQLIHVSGPDSMTFLQGQLTCDLTQLQPGQSQLGAYCDRKGRMIANFHVSRLQDDYFICLPSSMAEMTLSTLNRYKLFAKTQLTLTPAYRLFGVSGYPELHLPTTAHRIAFASPCQHQLIAIDQDNADAYWQELLASHPILTTNQWERHLIACGFAYIQPNTSQKFLPQMLNWDELGGVCYSKGCYIGQEIVARAHYRGQVKKRAEILLLPQDLQPELGAPLPAPNKGTVVAFTQADEHYLALAVTRKPPTA